MKLFFMYILKEEKRYEKKNWTVYLVKFKTVIF